MDNSKARPKIIKVDQNVVARTRGNHIENGWPHYSRRTGLCLCLDPCCLGINGCRCRGCKCKIMPGEYHTERSPLPLTSADIIL
jgi:hypothetical protein